MWSTWWWDVLVWQVRGRSWWGWWGRRWQWQYGWWYRVTTVLDYACKNGGVGRLVEIIWRKWFVAGAWLPISPLPPMLILISSCHIGHAYWHRFLFSVLHGVLYPSVRLHKVHFNNNNNYYYYYNLYSDIYIYIYIYIQCWCSNNITVLEFTVTGTDKVWRIYIGGHFSWISYRRKATKTSESRTNRRLSLFWTSRCVRWMSTSTLFALLFRTRKRSDAKLGNCVVSFAACPVCGFPTCQLPTVMHFIQYCNEESQN